MEYGSCLARLNGYLEDLKEAGIKKKEEYIVSDQTSITDEKAYNLARKLLYGGVFVPIFAFNDMVAAAVYKAASDMGMYLPEDLSVVGFDDTEWARYVTPPLTTVGPAKRAYKKGYDAAKILIESFEHPELLQKNQEYRRNVDLLSTVRNIKNNRISILNGCRKITSMVTVYFDLFYQLVICGRNMEYKK